jgi:2-polyprenyl-6-methoxyphenol hydroxylase-like FAD-dependent oxidoreductase
MAEKGERRNHAVVIGGSVAGLVTARVLSRHFAQVTVVERDELPHDTSHRRGVPQAHHAHVLLMRGRQILEEFFPGIVDETVRRGGRLIDMADEMEWITPAGRGVRYPSDLQMLAASRRLLESVVRDHVRRDSRVTLVDRHEMLGLEFDEAHSAIGGVRIAPVDSARAVTVLNADFVVDASGRGSKMPRWLRDIGYPAPCETVVTAHLGYGSRIYRMPAGFRRDWTGVFVQAAPPQHPRFGVIMPIEDGEWLVSLGGGDGEHPPADNEGFLAFARSLRDASIYDAIKDAEPLTSVVQSQATQNRLRHFERLSRFPERLAVLGDAACAFNPVYAQGMTIAALGAKTLDDCLGECPDHDLTGVGRKFQRALARVNTTPWMLAVGEDCRYLRTEGANAGIVDRLMHRYMDRVVELTTYDIAVRDTLLRAFHMLIPLTAIFRRGVMRRVLGRKPGKPAVIPPQAVGRPLETPAVRAR